MKWCFRYEGPKKDLHSFSSSAFMLVKRIVGFCLQASKPISYVRIRFSTSLPKLSFYVKLLGIHVILNHSQDDMWHFFMKMN